MPLDTEKLIGLIQDLDHLVPREGAAVKLDQYGGGPDESRLAANRAGYLRLGIEFLKAAFAEPVNYSDDPIPDKNGDGQINVDLDYMILRGTEIHFDWFERTENLKAPDEYDMSNRWSIGCMIQLLLLIAVTFFMTWGFVSFFKLIILRW
ncbi:MAG: hypothetical protein JEZ02_17935 [Desulfatibacillum sp.]|nr:hypothetical protein [Desulfatibacillum sp.]